jgi:hypothetical protein
MGIFILPHHLTPHYFDDKLMTFFLHFLQDGCIYIGSTSDAKLREVSFDMTINGYDVYYETGTLTCSSGCDYSGVFDTCPVDNQIGISINVGNCYPLCSSGSNCTTCPDNSYYAYSEQGQRRDTRNCTKCGVGKYIVGQDNATDHSSGDDCDSCGPGTYLEGETCSVCSAGM